MGWIQDKIWEFWRSTPMFKSWVFPVLPGSRGFTINSLSYPNIILINLSFLLKPIWAGFQCLLIKSAYRTATAVPWLLEPVTFKLMGHFVFIGLKTKAWWLSVLVVHRSEVDHAVLPVKWRKLVWNIFAIEETIWNLLCIIGNGARNNSNWCHLCVIFISAHISLDNMSRKENSCNLSEYNKMPVYFYLDMQSPVFF